MTQIFDRDLVRKHLQRAGASGVDFLWRKIAGDIQDRLLDIRRDFAVGVEIAPKPLVFTPEFLARKTVAQPLFLSALSGEGAALIDEEFLPLKPASLDVLVCSGSLHWVNDLPGALLQMKRALKPDGVMIAAMFGGETLYELRDVMARVEAAHYDGISPRVSPFATLPDMAALMQRAQFSLPVVDNEKIAVTYSDITALIADMRAMGQNNAVLRKNTKPVSRDFWAEVDRLYRADHATQDGRLKATVEILYMIGWSPDASQQQPLARGSATHRLADILRTDEIGSGEFAP